MLSRSNLRRPGHRLGKTAFRKIQYTTMTDRNLAAVLYGKKNLRVVSFVVFVV